MHLYVPVLLVEYTHLFIISSAVTLQYFAFLNDFQCFVMGLQSHANVFL